MDTTIESIVDFIETHQGRMTYTQYTSLMGDVAKLHNETPEGLEAERLRKAEQIREDERVARELVAKDIIQNGYVFRPPQVDLEGKGTSIVSDGPPVIEDGNIHFHAPIPKDSNILYHRYCTYEQKHKVFNHKTGKWAQYYGKVGTGILQSFGLTRQDFEQKMASHQIAY